jgi:cellulose synthase/poly-beta-1,6-N-acetylglucosamine synthase-like glycosyltransferase
MLRVLGLGGLGRAWLRRAVLGDLLSRPRDITVVIGVRNRADYRIANALRSIREQTYAAELVRVLVVDYGSEPSSQAAIMNLCRQHDAEYLPVDEAPVWSRARCLNIGIRRASTTFLMTSDADVMFSRRYLADAIRTLEASPLSVLASSMLDLPQESVEVMKNADPKSMEGLVLAAFRCANSLRHCSDLDRLLPFDPRLRRVLRVVGLGR